MKYGSYDPSQLRRSKIVGPEVCDRTCRGFCASFGFGARNVLVHMFFYRRTVGEARPDAANGNPATVRLRIP
jgi:hypothetical protein